MDYVQQIYATKSQFPITNYLRGCRRFDSPNIDIRGCEQGREKCICCRRLVCYYLHRCNRSLLCLINSCSGSSFQHQRRILHNLQKLSTKSLRNIPISWSNAGVLNRGPPASFFAAWKATSQNKKRYRSVQR